MIQRHVMFEPLLAADPSFQPRWNAFLADWGDEPELPFYLVLRSLAEHLLKRLEDKDTEGFGRIFDVVERWHTEGDAYVREAASIGLLEALQDKSGGSGIRPTTVEPWLGRESERSWRMLDRFWEGNASAPGFDC